MENGLEPFGYDKLAKDLLMQDCRTCKYHIQSLLEENEHCTIKKHSENMMVIALAPLFKEQQVYARPIPNNRTCNKWVVDELY